MRLYEFSKKVGVSSKKLLQMLQEAGFAVKSHMSVLDEAALLFLNKQFKKEKLIPDEVKENVMQKEPVKKSKILSSKKPRSKNVSVSTEPRITPTDKPSPREVIVEPMSVAQAAERIGEPVNELILTLLKWGIVAPINQILTEKIVERLADHYELKTIKPEVLKKELVKGIRAKGAEIITRPPVIVVLGHVDHGKTTLLDFIRKTRVVAKEKGGITQHLGAYEAETAHGKLVFLDTPGHEAFSKMRERGAKAADVAVLIVAADDGVMPQTVEAIKHAKAMELPIIVAINKMDKVDPSRLEVVKRQLASHDVLPEDWGGQAICLPISAKEGTGVDRLLEMIALQSQIMELHANINVPAKGFVLESKLEKGRGPVATIICQHGTLKVGDYFICGNATGRVTTLVDSHGNRINEAGPSIPVQVASFDQLPDVGDFFEVVPKKQALSMRGERAERKKVPVKSLAKEEDVINLLLKADSNASKEALVDAIDRLSKKVTVNFNIIQASVGSINESDIELASNTGSDIIGLHVKLEANTASFAQKRGVSVTLYDIIYKLLESLEERAEREKKVEMVTTKIGEAVVRRVFDIKNIGVVAGSYVQDGRFSRDGSVVVWRGNQKVGEGKIKSLQREKKMVKEAHTGFECGFVVEGFSDWAVDDKVECFIEVPASEKK